MSLSKPKSPVFITEGLASDAPQVSSNSQNNATLINQLHGIANTDTNGAGIPKQVSNVQVSIANAQAGTTCTVSVLFSQDPTDKNFAGVAILVKGYQGNNQLVQVSSGVSSPAKFVLNNTGEIVSFTVQAYGNSGSAPLSTAPTCSGTLPQSTSGGFGSSTSTSTPPATFQTQGVNNKSQKLLNIEAIDSSILVTNPSGGNVAIQGPQFGLALPSWWMCCDGSNYTFDGTNGTFSTGNANEVKFWMIRIPYPIKVKTMTFRYNGAGSGGVGGMAIYDSTGQTKLVSFDNFAFSGSAGPKTITNTGGATITLGPGVYIVACAQSTTGTSATTQGGYHTQSSSDNTNGWNANATVRSGVASNAMSSGVLPASLGTLSLTTSLGSSLPCCCFEPA
jgi:hypothetical protein